jgi:hypothetical protein
VAERQLATLSPPCVAGVSDLVLDMRYNGGGYLVVAAELAYMIAGPGQHGKVFENLPATTSCRSGAAAVPVSPWAWRRRR